MPETVRRGSTGPAVREAQYLLARHQYLQATDIDGSFGAATDAAVRRFQHDHGLGADGIVGPRTWEGLLASFPFPPPTLDDGAAGPVVSRLQQVLNDGRSEFDPGTPPLPVDGVYGPRTKRLVAAFQRWAGVPADGVVGLRTWAVSLHAAGQQLASAVGV
jgi:peptidoglycan hydrolase-like protein with peptidoglycan-binding domain